MALKTDYKDAVFSGERKYQEIFNNDGTKSFTDRTVYTEAGDKFGANDINATNAAINATNAAINATNDVREVWMRVNGFTPAAPYVLRIDVPGMKSTDTPVISHTLLNGVTDPGTIKGAWKAYSCIDRVDTFDGYMLVTCYRKKPVQDILLNIKGVGI